MSDVLFVTATYRTDLDRVRLLRRSLREVGAAEQFHHLVVLNHEDLHLADDLRSEPNLDLISTRDVLIAPIERRRAAAHFRRTSAKHWVRGGAIPGWYAQQLVKLGTVGAAGGAQAIVFWDSDLVALRPVERTDFVAESGRTCFYVDDDMRGDGSDSWNRVSAQLLKVDESLVDGRQFIHAPMVMDVGAARAMLESLNPLAPRGWQQAMHAANAFEYPTYGAWVMGNALDEVETTPPIPTANFVEFEDMWDFRERAGQIIEAGQAKVLAVQSRLHIPPSSYESIVEAAWH